MYSARAEPLHFSRNKLLPTHRPGYGCPIFSGPFWNLSPASGTFQNRWHTHKTQCHRLFPICRWHSYNEKLTDVNEIHRVFNNLAPTINFTLEKETDNQINFMDITIQNSNNRLSFNVYRKPTTTDVIIPNDSCHPPRAETCSHQAHD